VQAPFAEVLAVVAEHPIAILSHPRTRAADHFSALKANPPTGSDPDTASPHEASKRNLFHRSPERVRPEGPVVNDPPVTDIDTVMDEAEARSEQMRTQRRFLVERQKSVVPPQVVCGYLHDMSFRGT
jgi:hypothetical protein